MIIPVPANTRNHLQIGVYALISREARWGALTSGHQASPRAPSKRPASQSSSPARIRREPLPEFVISPARSVGGFYSKLVAADIISSALLPTATPFLSQVNTVFQIDVKISFVNQNLPTKLTIPPAYPPSG